jgi:hypothetical protein
MLRQQATCAHRRGDWTRRRRCRCLGHCDSAGAVRVKTLQLCQYCGHSRLHSGQQLLHRCREAGASRQRRWVFGGEQRVVHGVEDTLARCLQGSRDKQKQSERSWGVGSSSAPSNGPAL